MKNKGAKIFVNSITMTRVIGTFLLPFISIFMSPSSVVIYIVALLLTDSIDGIMARRLNACTIFGAILDASADKLLGIATLGVLAHDYPIMLLPILTETLITLINTSGATKGGSIDSSFLGKFKTWIMGICIVIGFCTVYSEEIILIFTDTKIGLYFANLFNSIIAYKTLIMNSLASICVGAGIMVAADYKARVKSDVKKAELNGLKAKEFRIKKGRELINALFDTEYYFKTKNEPLLQRLGEKENKHEKKNRRK